MLFSCSVVSDSSVTPCGLQPTRLLCLWDFLIKNSGEGNSLVVQGLELLGFSLAWGTKILHVPQCSQKQNKLQRKKTVVGECWCGPWHLDIVLGSKAKLLQMGCSQAMLVTFNNGFCGERVGWGALVCNHCQFLWCKCFSSGLI